MPALTVTPARGGLPLLGHALRMRNDPLGFFESLRDQGDIVKIKLGPQTAYVVTSAEVIREMLVVKPREFDKGASLEQMRTVFGNGLANSDGELHRQHRLLMQPAFRRDRIAEYARLMSNEIRMVADTWTDGQKFDVSREMSALTLAVTCRAMMSSDVAGELTTEMQHGMPFVLDVMYGRMVNPLGKALEKLPTARNRKFVKTLERLHRMADKVVADYRRGDESERNDLLTLLLLAKDAETGTSLSDQEVHDQIMTILVAGTETTASTLSWAFHALAEHPAMESRLHAEVDEVLSGRTAEYEDLRKLPYTTQLVSETLRYYPPAWILTRRAKHDVDLSGYLIPSGTSIMFSPYVVHRDRNLYQDPDEFDPDRWSPERAGEIPREAIAHFGAGPRKCIGDVFAIVEASLALATIAAQWRLRPTNTVKVEQSAGMTLAPQKLHMIIDKR